MSAFAQRALIGGFPYPLWPFGPSPPDRGSRPPDPRLRGDAFLGAGWSRPAGKTLKGFPFLPPGHWALNVQNLVDGLVEITPPGLA